MQKLIATTVLLTLSFGLSGQIILPDEYWGGVPTDDAYNQDVIGDPNVFDITGYSFETVGDSLTIQIHGNYFEAIMKNEGLYETFMGDLFISTDGLSWNDGGAATLNDYVGSGVETSWEYVVSINPRDNAGDALADFETDGNPNEAVAKNAPVYAVTDTGNIETSFITINGHYREHQELSYDGSNQNPLATTASWFFSDDYSFLGITLDNSADIFGNSNEIGFHWTMSCGNDVIEFEYTTVTPVPEPSQIGALGIVGLGAFLIVRRRLRRRASARA